MEREERSVTSWVSRRASICSDERWVPTVTAKALSLAYNPSYMSCCFACSAAAVSSRARKSLGAPRDVTAVSN